MRLKAWRVSFPGQSVLIGEQSLVEYLSSVTLYPVPGASTGWSAVILYEGLWLPVQCWEPHSSDLTASVLVLQVPNALPFAVRVNGAPTRCEFSDEDFMPEQAKLPVEWLWCMASCVELKGEVLPILATEKLLVTH